MNGGNTVCMATKKQISVNFIIPGNWDPNNFILELAGAYDDADSEAAEQVEYVVGEILEVEVGE